MALERRNLFHCGLFRYSCALENVSKLEITEEDVYMMSAHAFEHMRQTKEFGLRVLFSVPLGPGRPSFPSPHSTNASTPASFPSNSMSTISGGTAAAGGGSGGGGGGGGGNGAGFDGSDSGGSAGGAHGATVLSSRG
ncbi:unnamed protein product, partial [Laminaria digitata]